MLSDAIIEDFENQGITEHLQRGEFFVYINSILIPGWKLH